MLKTIVICIYYRICKNVQIIRKKMHFLINAYLLKSVKQQVQFHSLNLLQFVLGCSDKILQLDVYYLVQGTWYNSLIFFNFFHVKFNIEIYNDTCCMLVLQKKVCLNGCEYKARCMLACRTLDFNGCEYRTQENVKKRTAKTNFFPHLLH